MKKKSLLGTVLSASMLFMSCAQAATQKATDGANEGQGVVSLQSAQAQFPGSVGDALGFIGFQRFWVFAEVDAAKTAVARAVFAHHQECRGFL